MKTTTRILATVLITALALALLSSPAFAGGKPRPPRAAPSFSANMAMTGSLDAQTVCVCFCNLPKGAHVEETRFYSPDGAMYQAYSSTLSSRTRACVVTHQLPIAGTWAAGMPGTWTVRVFLDGQCVVTQQFTLGPPYGSI
jgi:hypothetical protein